METKETVAAPEWRQQVVYPEWQPRKRGGDPERRRAAKKRHRAAAKARDPEKYRAKDQRRKARAKARNPDAFKVKARRWLLRRFGLSPEDYDRMLAAQGGVCAICKQPETNVYRRKPGARGPLKDVVDRVRSLAVDHDHITNTVRGLLCGACNRGIGSLKDDHAICQAAADYLRGQG